MQTLKLLLLMLISTILLACGSQKVQTNLTSTDDSESFRVPADYKIADCHDFSASGVSGIITSHYSLGTIDLKKIDLRVFNLPAEIVQSDNHKIEFYIWKENSSGQLDTRSEPVSFTLQNLKTGNFINTTYNFLSTANIKSIISDNNLETTVEGFLRDHKFILSGLENDGNMYHAATMGIYDIENANSQPVNSVSFLLPHIPAHPKVYRAQHQNQNLIQLHPNYDLINTLMTDSEYFARTEQYCQDFMQN